MLVFLKTLDLIAGVASCFVMVRRDSFPQKKKMMFLFPHLILIHFDANIDSGAATQNFDIDAFAPHNLLVETVYISGA